TLRGPKSPRGLRIDRTDPTAAVGDRPRRLDVELATTGGLASDPRPDAGRRPVGAVAGACALRRPVAASTARAWLDDGLAPHGPPATAGSGQAAGLPAHARRKRRAIHRRLGGMSDGLAAAHRQPGRRQRGGKTAPPRPMGRIPGWPGTRSHDRYSR